MKSSFLKSDCVGFFFLFHWFYQDTPLTVSTGLNYFVLASLSSTPTPLKPIPPLHRDGCWMAEKERENKTPPHLSAPVLLRNLRRQQKPNISEPHFAQVAVHIVNNYLPSGWTSALPMDSLASLEPPISSLPSSPPSLLLLSDGLKHLTLAHSFSFFLCCL